MFFIQKTTPVKKNQPVIVAVSRGSSLKIPLNPTNYMFFECISGENGRNFKPVGPLTNRLYSKITVTSPNTRIFSGGFWATGFHMSHKRAKSIFRPKNPYLISSIIKSRLNWRFSDRLYQQLPWVSLMFWIFNHKKSSTRFERKCSQ